MSDIFISYASQDRKVAKALATLLADEGWSVWWDRTIIPGQSFVKMIENALNDAKCVVVLWSTVSRDSDWVQNEARYGHERHVLVPILIEDVKPPFEFQHIHAALLVDWDGGRSHSSYSQIVAAISGFAGLSQKRESEAKQKPQEEQAKREAEAESARREAEKQARRKAEKQAETERTAREKEAGRNKAEAEKLLPEATPVPPGIKRSKSRGIVVGAVAVVLGIGLAIFQPWKPSTMDKTRVEVERSASSRGTPAEPDKQPQEEPEIEVLDAQMVALSKSNVREGPGTEYGKVTTLALGESVAVTGHVEDWYRVALNGGREGYVFKELLRRSATSISDIRVTQVVQKGSDVSVYFAALDNMGEPLLSLDPNQLSLFIDGRPTDITNIVSVSEGDDGVAYIFLIDISVSLKGHFGQLRQALAQWIGQLDENDQAAIVTVESDVKQLVGFTGDRDRLQAAIETLGPQGSDTLLFRGIIEATRIGSKFYSPPGLPARRAIVMLSDGDNDPPGAYDALTPPRFEDVKEEVFKASIPIFALWLPSDEERERTKVGRENLVEFARLSHGEFHKAEDYGGDLETAFADLRDRIKEGFVAHVVCHECPPGLLPKDVQVRLR